MMTDTHRATEPIAVIGLSCRFAGSAHGPEQLWTMMKEKRSAWSEIPESRFGHKGQYHPENEKLSTTNVKGAHFMEEDIGLFDASFFGFTAEVASAMDPQYRIQLESTYQAFENAGLSLIKIAGSNTSVYAGVFTHDYYDGIMRDGDNLPRSTLIGTFSAMAANRISHFFDLQGPSMSIDTGCSGALVSLHQAVLGLRAREADMSVVCGSNLLLAPDCFKIFSSLSMLSPDGKCYAFDSRANGYGRGEGVGTVIIKRLSDAIKDGDPIRAVIRETALNQDGRSETITSPSQAAQIQLIRETYRRAGLHPNDTQYFEAHGTGTPTGDSVEARSIGTVFGPQSTGREQPLRIGSVKTFLGHTEAASGMAALIKVILAMEKGEIPPNINFEKPNEKLQLEQVGLKVVTDLEPWPAAENETRRSSINNFGYGGTNSHVIIEDARLFNPTKISTRNETDRYLETRSEIFVLYGRDEQACQRMMSSLSEYLEVRSSTAEDTAGLIEDLIWTLSHRRTRFSSGWISAHAVQWSGNQNVIQQVIHCLENPQFKPVRLPGDDTPRIGMVFTGQGAQWYAMGRELIGIYQLFRSTLKEAEQYLFEFGADWSLTEELMKDSSETRVNHTSLSIPICVAIQIALLRLLSSWDIVPTAVVSHSSGEIAAAYAARALGLREAMAVAYYRAAMAGEMTSQSMGPKGAMVAVGVGEEAARRYLSQLTEEVGKAVVACVNSPSSITLAGDERAIEKILELAIKDGVFARRLKVETGYHSHHMLPIAESYRNALRSILQSSEGDNGEQLPIIFSSPVTGGRLKNTKQLTNPDHWVDSLVQPVEFVKAFTDMVHGELDGPKSNVDIVLEVGPHTALGGPIKEIMLQPGLNALNIPYMGCLVRNENARDCMLAMCSNLMRKGKQINMSRVELLSNTPRPLTNLPGYPFNHTIRHWVESRNNQSYRKRTQEVHHLLGFPVPGTNPDAATWRQQVRISDSPWLRDHAVQGTVLYPGAGYICLAIEAMKQLTENDGTLTVTDLTLHEIEFHQALVVPENSEGIEVQTVLHSADEKEIGAVDWKRWEVLSVTRDSHWTQHAKGFIQVNANANANINKIAETFISNSGYIRRIDPEDMWAGLRALGLNHGPTFRNMSEIIQDGRSSNGIRRCMTTITVPQVEKSLDRHVIHPTTLDSIIVSSITALPNAGTTDLGPRVPRSIKRIGLSCSLSSRAGHSFSCRTTLPHYDAQKLLADITLVDDQHSVLEIERLVCQSLGPSVSMQNVAPWTTELYTEVKWIPDLTGSLGLEVPGSKQALVEKLNSSTKMGKFESDVFWRLRRVCVYFIHHAVQNLTEQNLDQRYGRYFSWMNATLGLAAARKMDPQSHTWLTDSQQVRNRQIALAASQSVEGELVCHIGPMLRQILNGSLDPAEIMTKDLVGRYQENSLRLLPIVSQFKSIIRMISLQKPRGRILQLGSSGNVITRQAFDMLDTQNEGGPFIDSWHFTERSSCTFDGLRDEFTERSGYLKVLFDELDIEQDPVAQGFELQSYDLVIAMQTPIPIRNLGGALTHMRSLLKPGGSLLVVETTQVQVDQMFIFGLLPSWWTCQDVERQTGPYMSSSQWQGLLTSRGFTGVNLELCDYRIEDELRSTSIILSSVPPQVQMSSEEFVIVTSIRTPPPKTWLEKFDKSIANATKAKLSEMVTIESAPNEYFRDKVCIFLGETEQPLLHNLNDAALRGIKNMVSNCKVLVWITRGGAVGHENPKMSLAAGLLRVLRNESVGPRLILLDIDPGQGTWSESSSSAIVHILNSALTCSPSPASFPIENEFAIRNGLLLVSRLHKEPKRNALFSSAAFSWPTSELLSDIPLFHSDHPLSLKVGIPGQLETLAFSIDKTEQCPLGDEDVEIEPRAYGIDDHDLSVATGQIHGRSFETECAGLITRLGTKAVKQGFQVGDKVIALPQCSIGSHTRVSWHSIAHMPQRLDFIEAATLPRNFSTAYIALINIARIRQGQSLLIHAGASGFGQAAIMLAKHYLGAEVYVTVSSQSERDLITSQYGIIDDRIFASDESFARDILAVTGGRGVDVVLNSLPGALLQASFDVVASFGHFVEIGRRDADRHSLLNMTNFSRTVSFTSLDVMSIIREQGHEAHRILNEVVRLITQGCIHPVRPVNIYAIGDVIDAFRHVQSRDPSGKVILAVENDERVKVVPAAPFLDLKSDATYMLVGGVGGIGRSIAHWMAAHGARNIIVLSRGAEDSPNIEAFVASLQEVGCRVVPIACDVARMEDLSRVLNTCKEKLPPIRGIVNGAMALHDSFFNEMDLQKWKAVIRPKVSASWNLHSQFTKPDSLDFFVMLSSISGILGIASQANYAAGCAYQDSLAHHRRSMGLPAVSLDLGIVKEIGYASRSEARAVLNNWRRAGQTIILSEEAVLQAFETALLYPHEQPQLVVGLNTGPGPQWESIMGRDARFQALTYRESVATRNHDSGMHSNGHSQALAEHLKAIRTSDEAIHVVGEAIAVKLAEVFMIPAEDIDLRKSPVYYGVDSLVAVELRNMLTLQAAADISIFNILQSATLADMAKDVVAKSKFINFSIS